MNGMSEMWDSLLDKIGVDTVYDAAAEYGYDTFFVEDRNACVPEDVAIDFFIELITFIMEALHPINPTKVQEWLDMYNISEDDIQDYMS